jgi:hypothetical protein
MNWYHYWHETKLLILSSGTSNLFIYRILPRSNYETFPTLQLSLPRVRTSRGIEPLPVQVTRLHVHLLTFHGHNYVGFLNNWIGTTTLSLYRVTSKTCYRKEYELDLLQQGSFAMNTTDNLLVVHNLTCKQTMVYDVKSPFPSQILLKPTPELFEFLGNKKDSAVDLIETDWYSCTPSFIVSPSSGRVFVLQINLAYFLDMMAQRSDFSSFQLTEFIIRRRSPQSYPLRINPLKKAIAIELDITVLRPMFDLLYIHYDVQRYRVITRIQPNRLKPISAHSSVSDLSSRFSSSVSMHPPLQDIEDDIVSFQDDIFCHLFTPLMSRKVTKYHIYCLLEFIESQRAFDITIKPFLYDLLVHVLVETSSHNQLFQLLQFGIIPDSLTMANLLTQTSEPDSTPFKFGLEMLKRMDCHHDVLQLFTESGKLLDALQYAEQTYTIRILKPFPFLEAALLTGNKTLFLNVYRCFEEHGLIPLSPQVDLDFLSVNRDGINRYISIYREIWGPKIDMELC